MLSHYRDFVVPGNGATVAGAEVSGEEGKLLRRYHEWLALMRERESFKRTLCSGERMIERHAKYANSAATTLVAEATRKGVAAP